MTEPMVMRLLSEQRKRMMASILNAVDNADADPRVRREHIITAINVFYDFCRDIIKVGDEDVMRNDAALELLQRVHSSQRALSEQLAAKA